MKRRNILIGLGTIALPFGHDRGESNDDSATECGATIRSGICDRIVDGRWAVILDEDAGIQWEVPVESTPSYLEEGAPLLFRGTEDRIIEFADFN